MPLVFIIVALLFWLTVVTVVVFVRLSRSALRWVAALGHSPRGSADPVGPTPVADGVDNGFTA